MQRILVLEDDEALRELIAAFCEEEGYEVEAVGCLASAAERLHAGTFDLVLRDSIAATPAQFYAAFDPLLAERGHPPVVVISAHALESERVESLGYAALIAKPFDIDVLSDALRRLLEPTPGATD
jgi:DNA-binding response OmpR family regulator